MKQFILILKITAYAMKVGSGLCSLVTTCAINAAYLCLCESNGKVASGDSCTRKTWECACTGQIPFISKELSYFNVQSAVFFQADTAC